MKRIKDSVDAIIFDMDGTILDTNAVWDDAVLAVIKKNGVSVEKNSPDHFALLIKTGGQSLPIAMTIIKSEFNLATSVDFLVRDVIGTAKEMLESDIKFIQGFQDFHKEIQLIPIPNAIGTNCHPDSLPQLVTNARLDSFFGKHIYTFADAGKPKPHPDLFLYAAKQLGANPERCVVFEDSQFGFDAANAAGMKCVAIKNDHNKDFYEKHTHAGINTYDEAIDELVKLYTDITDSKG